MQNLLRALLEFERLALGQASPELLDTEDGQGVPIVHEPEKFNQ